MRNPSPDKALESKGSTRAWAIRTLGCYAPSNNRHFEQEGFRALFRRFHLLTPAISRPRHCYTVAVSLDIHQRDREGIVIADLKGRIVMGPEVSHFRELLSPIISQQGSRTILNMAHVDYVDSTGLGAMVYLASAAKKSGSAIKLLQTNARNLELLVTTKLETIFENFETEQDAVNSFFPDRAVQKFDILEFVRDHQKDED